MFNKVSLSSITLLIAASFQLKPKIYSDLIRLLIASNCEDKLFAVGKYITEEFISC